MKSRNAISWLVAGQIMIGIGSTLFAQQTNVISNRADRLTMLNTSRPDASRPLFSSLLTEEQRHSLEPIVQADQEELRKLETKLRDARRDLTMAGIRPNFDEAAVRKQAQVMAEIQSDIEMRRLKQLSQVKPPLSQEQIQKIKALSSVSTPGMRPQPPLPVRLERLDPGVTRTTPPPTLRLDNGQAPKP
jgi:hypothetical protein